MLQLIVLVTVVALVAASLLVAWRSRALRSHSEGSRGVHGGGHDVPESRTEP